MTTIPESIALVDFLHMLTVNVKQVLSDPKADPSIAVGRTLKQLAAVRSSCAHVVVCLDSPPYWRKAVYADYKGKRSEREPEWKPLMQATLERVHQDGYNVARADNEEADDVVATLSRIYSTEYDCRDVRIVGADKDALQCVSDRVRCFVPKGEGEFDIRGPEWLKKELDVTPEDFPLLLAIMGDTSDNIPGIKGLGKGHGAKLINIYKTPEGIAKGLVNAQQEAELTGKPLAAVWKNYAAGMAQLPLWLRLTKLNTDASLELHPLKYLERIEPRQLVATELWDDSADSDIEREAIQEEGGLETVEPDWEAIAAATAERERAELAAALPVGTGAGTLSRPSADEMKGLTQKMVDALPVDTAQAARDRATAAANVTLPADAPKGAKPTEAQVDAKQAEIAAGNAAERTRPKADAPAGPAGTDTAAATHPDAPAQVVPKTQGPQSEKLAVVPFPAPSWELATQPRSPSEMALVAARFHNSRFYAAHGNADGTFAVIALGRELGLGAAASVEGFHIVNQRPFAKAVMLKALAERDPNCEWLMITSADAKHATIKTKHKKIPEVLEYTYTIERAAAAGYLTGKNSENWKTKTQEMLEARATSKGVRRWYPGSTFGMHSQEEAYDD